MRPKLLIDTVPLLSPLTGVGKYTYEVSNLLQNYEDFEWEYFYGYYSKELIQPSTHQGVKSLKSAINRFPFIKSVARELLLLSSRVFATNYDIYWQPNFIPNRGVKANKIVTTIHDFSFMLHRDFHSKETLDYFDNNFLKNIYRSDSIITVSNFIKNEIIERLDFEANRVEVIYNGVDHNLFKPYENIKLNFSIPKKFILSVGSIEPRKNLIRLLQAYSNLNKNLQNEYKLVLVGFKGWENREIMKLMEQNENIIYLGFLSTEDLVKVYNLATYFIYPSLYEGFGLPILEAMACGTAVISSNSSSLPEVGGDAVIYCNPHSIEDIQNKMEYLLDDRSLREELSQKGIEQAQKFSWENSAQKHLKLFKNFS